MIDTTQVQIWGLTPPPSPLRQNPYFIFIFNDDLHNILCCLIITQITEMFDIQVKGSVMLFKVCQFDIDIHTGINNTSYFQLCCYVWWTMLIYKLGQHQSSVYKFRFQKKCIDIVAFYRRWVTGFSVFL